jgi:rhodanese-related sulfurtransferase
MNLKDKIKNLTLNQKLAAVLLVLAVIALFAGDPYSSARTSIDAQELAVIVDSKVDHVTVEELADWIIQSKADYRLIDLRTEKEYGEYNIPTSENILLPDLLKAGLQRNEKIVIYSEGGIHSAQAWFLLRARNYKSVYILFGGLEEWKDKILFPRIAENASPEQQKAFEKIKQVSKYFGGTPQSGPGEAVQQTQVAMPKLALPSGGSAAGTKPTGKKKKEGC